MTTVAGHSGSATANYVAQRLPKYIRNALRELIEIQLQRRVDRENLVANADAISTMLQGEIKKLDDDIGLAVRTLPFKDPDSLTDQQAWRLIDEHEEVFERAFQGTSVALALINVDHCLIWAAGLGNSTVGECCTGAPDLQACSLTVCLSDIDQERSGRRTAS